MAESPKPPVASPSLWSSPAPSPASAPTPVVQQTDAPPPPLPQPGPQAKPPDGTVTALFVNGEAKAGMALPITVEGAQDGSGLFTVEAPNETRNYFRARPGEGFTIPVASSGTYRITLRQPNERGEFRVVGTALTFEVV